MNAITENLAAVVTLGEDFPEIRDGVRRICADFPQSYWRELDKREGYPSEFVQAMTDAGFLASLIPEEYGGAGLSIRAAGVILQECHANGCYAAAAHAQSQPDGRSLVSPDPERRKLKPWQPPMNA